MPRTRRICEFTIRVGQAPYERGYRWAYNEYVGPVVVIIGLTDEDGVVGWGEFPMSFHPFVPDRALEAMASALIERLVVGQTPEPRAFAAAATAQTGWLWYPHLGAVVIGGIEMALWDLLGKQLGANVTDLLGGRVRDAMECMWFIFDDDVEAMVTSAATGAERGFRRFYIKWFGDEETMVTKIRSVHSALPGHCFLRIDPNESWTRSSAVRRLGVLADLRIEFVEQPLPRDDFDGAAILRSRTTVPLASDQGTRMMPEVLGGLKSGAFDTLSVAPTDAGGIVAALDIASVAGASGIAVSMHSSNELAIGVAALIVVACLAPNCSYVSQAEYTHLDWDVSRDIKVDGPYLSVDWERSGLGVEPDPELLEKAEQYFRSVGGNRLPIDDPRRERLFVPGY